MTDSSATEDPVKQADGTAGERLLRAAKTVLTGLGHRIETADKEVVPVFDGIAELHAAIYNYERTMK